MLKIEDLHVSVNGRKIINGVNFTAEDGKVYVILGKNGGGKTSLLMSIMGIPKYKIESGKILFNGTDITNLGVYERAKMGIAMAFQRPPVVNGVKLIDVVRNPMFSDVVGVPDSFFERDLNSGLSGGETKRSELLQVLSMRPKLALLDEPDSGVDIDSIKYILNAINELRKMNATVMVVTHNIGVVKSIGPDEIVVIGDGRIIRRGGVDILNNINFNGDGQ